MDGFHLDTDISLAEWDSFIESTPGGSIVQTSRWAELKTAQKWKVDRIALRVDGQVIAGAQLLIKPMPFAPWLGQLAYAPKAPVFRCINSQHFQQMISALKSQCGRRRVSILIIQPAESIGGIARMLAKNGFLPLDIDIIPSATVHIDLSPDEETIFRRFRKDLRLNILQAQKYGVTVRAGNAADIDEFYCLLKAASRRLRYPIQSLEYFKKKWEIFDKDHKIRLFMSEYQGKVLSAKLSLIFGDVIVDKRFGWTGTHAKMHPNELLDWESIRWAKSRGLRRYDLEGIDYDVAFQLARGKPKSEVNIKGKDSYKMKFGADIVLFPRASLLIFNPLAYSLGKYALSRPFFKKAFPEIVYRIRTII